MESCAGHAFIDVAAIKKPGRARLLSPHASSRRFLVRALAMFGLFYFPNPIAFLQHSSVAPRAKLVFL